MSYLGKKSKNLSAPRKFGYAAAAVIILFGFVMITFLAACDGETGTVQADEVVATVNSEEIYRDDFEQALEQEKMQYEMQGMDLDSEEMADTLRELEQHVLDNYFIIPTLIKQKAEEEGITVSDEEVEARYQEYAESFGGEEALLEQMEAVNMSREDIDEDIATELSIQNYLDYYMDSYLEENPEEKVFKDDIELTTAELEEYYQQLRSEFTEIREMIDEDDPEMPLEQIEFYYEQLIEQYGDILEEDDFEAVKPRLEEEIKEEMAAQMKEEKVQRVLSEHIAELQENSDIEKNI